MIKLLIISLGLAFVISKPCKDNCNENGICDDILGVCMCNPGFKGESCILKTCLFDCNVN